MEMMAAMVLLSLMAAVVLPNLQRWFGSVEARTERSKLAAQVQQVMTRAALLGQSVSISPGTSAQLLADGLPALSLPPGWLLVSPPMWRVSALGACEGVKLRFERALQTPGASGAVAPSDAVELAVQAGSCEVQWLAQVKQ
jgi:type II secretory pathway pseudopilin PulG